MQAEAFSEDSSRLFFVTFEALVADDGDAVQDVYLANTAAPPGSDPTPDPTTDPTPDPTTAVTPAPTAPLAPPPATPPATVKPSPGVTPAPALKAADVVKLPSTKRCVSRRKFRITLRTPRGTRITQATVFINKKRKTFKGSSIKPTLDLRGLPKDRVTVKIEIKTADGRKVSQTRRYRTCAPRRRAG